MSEESNGCGANKSWFRPPYGIFFYSSCVKHDYGYGKGGTKKDRLYCDTLFLYYMILDTWRIKSTFKKLYYQSWAVLYFLGVRFKGYKYFNYKK